jgi:chorismate dehydratase
LLHWLVSAALNERLRVAAIRFLNPAPLMWDFEHAPQQSRLAARYDVYSTLPARCADDLASGAADIGLIPVAAYATTPGLAVIPGCTIASRKHVRSILLVMRQDQSLKDVRTVAADTSSRASVAYARVIFKKFFHSDPQFIPHDPDSTGNLEAMLSVADAVLVIGDPALLALEQRATLEIRSRQHYQYCDMAEEWTSRTGLPWVSAFWGVRPEALARAGVSADEVIADFIASRDRGLKHINELVAEWSGKIAVNERTIRTYLTENIHYTLDDECLAGLGLFYRYAAETGVLPPAPPLRLLG